MKPKERVAIVTNIAWNLYNFRRGLALAIQNDGYEPVLMAAPDSYEKKLEEEGWLFVPIMHLQRTGINPLTDFKLFLEFKKVFRDYNIKVALNYNAKPLVFASLAASSLGIPFIPTITGLAGPFSGDRVMISKIVTVLYKIALKKSSQVIFQNTEDREFFIRENIVALNKTKLVNGSGVNMEKFRTEDFDHAPKDKIVFLMFSRLSVMKGVEYFANAAREIKKKYPNTEFKLAGPFDEDKYAVKKEDVKKWQEEGIIEYLGKSDFIQNEISMAHIIVYPSYYKEGIPKALMESAAMSKPIITTDNVGCREVVKNGYNGFLIPVKNLNALIEACEKFILMNEAGRSEMGKASRKIAEDKFDEKEVFSVYRYLIKEYVKN